MILAIDPGNKESAYVVIDEQLRPFMFAKVDNYRLLNEMEALMYTNKAKITIDHVAIEMVGHYGTGMPAGKEIFDTCVWIGRFYQYSTIEPVLILRKTVVTNICGVSRAKDANVIQALKDRFGDKGTVKNPGWFFGFKEDIWQAYAVGVTYADLYLKGQSHE